MMRIILAAIAFVMLATPSWGEERGISIRDIIDTFKDTLWSFYELKITLDLFVFILMGVFFLILALLGYKLISWILEKVSSFILEKIEPKDNSTYSYKIFYKVIFVLIIMFNFSILCLYYIVGGIYWLIVFFEAFNYTGFDLNQYRNIN
jgi:hypothetical protein